MAPRVTISILTYTALRQAKACIASVLKQTEPFNLILTANGNPEVASYFTDLAKNFANISVVTNSINQGFIDPHTHALSRCNTELFLLLNDDAILPEDGLRKLIAPFDQFPKAALSGPKDDFQTLLPNFHGTKGNAFEYLNGACLMCKTEIVKRHGLFDPNLKFAYGEDSDLSLRMREQGYSLHKADFRLIHERCATSKHVKEVRAHQEANHTYCRNRWAHYLRVRKMEFPIIVRRAGAFGDVLLTTPVIQALKWKYPLSPIHVETACPQIFINNPNVASAGKIARMSDALVFELNGSYEAKPNQHFVWTYAEKCGIAEDFIDDRTQFYLSDTDRAKAESLMPGYGWVAVHVGPSTWRSKEWPQDRFQAVIDHLRAAGNKVVLVGSAGRSNTGDLDRRGKTTIHEMGALIQRAKLFIGLDSFPLHCAEAVGTPAIGLFGVTDPKYILTRKTDIGVFNEAIPTFGLRHRKPGTTVVDDGGEAMNGISVSMVKEAIEKMLSRSCKSAELAPAQHSIQP